MARQPVEPSQQAEELIGLVKRLRGAACKQCARPLCGHEVVLVTLMGFQDTPLCVACLCSSLARTREEFLDQVCEHIRARDCFQEAWSFASRSEGSEDDARPACVFGRDDSPRAASEERPTAAQGESAADISAPAPDATWDAGDMACGDLVLELRRKLRPLAPGAVLRVTSRDPGAPKDLPAWCGLTGHRLVYEAHPRYWIQRKED